MARPQTSGNCALCGKSFKKGSMGKHLVVCREKHPSKLKGGKQATAFLIKAEGRRLANYWLFIEMPSEATLGHLDGFLRGVWLECCGHMSEFQIAKKAYGGSENDDFFGFDDMDDDEEEGASLLDVPLEDVLKVGDAFTYDYDFGSTTSLSLKVVAAYRSVFSKTDFNEVVRLLARNDPPEILCECGQPATTIDTQSRTALPAGAQSLSKQFAPHIGSIAGSLSASSLCTFRIQLLHDLGKR